MIRAYNGENVHVFAGNLRRLGGKVHHAVQQGIRATLSIGYADGLRRALAARGGVMLQGYRLPIIGRASMDSLIVDTTAVPEDAVAPGTAVEIIGSDQTVANLAAAMGTIGYEVLTSLGQRFTRVYRDDPADSFSAQLSESFVS